MVWAVVGASAVTLVGGMIQGDAAQGAADTQAQGARDAAAITAQQQAPWVAAGTKALGRLDQGLQAGGEYAKSFTMADATNSPAEQHALQQGTQAIQNSAAAKGGLLSTNTLQDLTKFGQDNAAQYQNQAFNQWNSQRGTQLGAQQALANVGQTAVNNVAEVGSNAALAGAGAQAGAQMAGGNAMNRSLGQIGNILGQSDIFNPKPSNTEAGSASQDINPDAYYGGSGDSSDWSWSDERLKKNERLVGHTMDGLPIYTFDMKGGGPTKMGVLAQDVEKTNPKAVKEHPVNRYKMVDYKQVT